LHKERIMVTRRRENAGKTGKCPPATAGKTMDMATGNGQTVFSEEERRRMIAEAAYFRSARREFAPGGELQDWLAAEREVNALFDAGRLARRPVGPVAKRIGALVETPPAETTAR
jgi:hypothetical protein